MKPYSAIVALTFMTCSAALATQQVQIMWGFGASESKKIVINGSVTTAATFTPYYELRMMFIGQDPIAYTEGRGFATFVHVDTGTHRTTPGVIDGTADLTGGVELNGNQYLLVIYEKSTGKYFNISESNGGASIAPYPLGEIVGDPLFDWPQEYYPESSTGHFYKGAEIPPFCGWLANQGLTQANLTGLNTNLVNKAFAVNANPTNFSDVRVSITGTTFAPNAISGAFALKSYDAANNPTTVTKLNGTAALSLLSSTSLSGAETSAPATFNLPNGTFQSPSGATNSAQFLRLKLNVPEVW